MENMMINQMIYRYVQAHIWRCHKILSWMTWNLQILTLKIPEHFNREVDKITCRR